uniref:Uncharacterized protein LOC111122862 n=1 Tax=Crassostrea virginica TaxID=6565 RepID=A0A8B8CY87_CRAVI|nr:uncharacterized protein LOC111122862 [Crassostrea virginica]
MAVSTRFYFTCVLVAVFSISYQGVSGQSLDCTTSPVTCLNSLTLSGDKEEICKSVETYFNCLENVIKQCTLVEDDILAYPRSFWPRMDVPLPDFRQSAPSVYLWQLSSTCFHEKNFLILHVVLM